MIFCVDVTWVVVVLSVGSIGGGVIGRDDIGGVIGRDDIGGCDVVNDGVVHTGG